MSKPGETLRKWFLLDASHIPVGRLASSIASLLTGKHRPTYTPHVDGGDFVVVTNAALVKLTGKKWHKKRFTWYSGYPGLKEVTASKLHEKDNTALIRKAVERMLPKNKLQKARMRRLKLYEGAEHPHFAQRLQPFPSSLLPKENSQLILKCRLLLRYHPLFLCDPPPVGDATYRLYQVWDCLKPQILSNSHLHNYIDAWRCSLGMRESITSAAEFSHAEGYMREVVQDNREFMGLDVRKVPDLDDSELLSKLLIEGVGETKTVVGVSIFVGGRLLRASTDFNFGRTEPKCIEVRVELTDRIDKCSRPLRKPLIFNRHEHRDIRLQAASNALECWPISAGVPSAFRSDCSGEFVISQLQPPVTWLNIHIAENGIPFENWTLRLDGNVARLI